MSPGRVQPKNWQVIKMITCQKQPRGQNDPSVKQIGKTFPSAKEDGGQNVLQPKEPIGKTFPSENTAEKLAECSK